mgnify:CR=1 FL=1
MVATPLKARSKLTLVCLARSAGMLAQDGFSQSKWVAERVLARAVAQYGLHARVIRSVGCRDLQALPLTCVRRGFMSPHRDSGVLDAHDPFIKLLARVIATGTYPQAAVDEVHAIATDSPMFANST